MHIGAELPLKNLDHVREGNEYSMAAMLKMNKINYKF